MHKASPRKLSQSTYQEQAIFGWMRAGLVMLVVVLFSLMNYFLWLYLELSIWSIFLILFPWIALAASLWIGGRYINRLYDLGSTKNGLKHLMAVLFDIFFPELKIGDEELRVKKSPEDSESHEEDDQSAGKPDEGDIFVEEQLGEPSLLERIGGPGKIKLQPGHAVVVESRYGTVRVLGEGKDFISSQEWIKERINLEEREGWIPSIKATSSDGVQLEITETRYRYRIYSQKPRSQQDPYPFDSAAVLKMVYSRPMSQQGISDWNEGIKLQVEGEIKKYISRHLLDQLTAPGIDCDEQPAKADNSSPCDPRREIANRFKDPDVLKSFQERGAEIRTFDIGHISIPNPIVSEQRVKVWQTRWDKDANKLHTDAEAQRLTIQDRGRAEAQAEMLMSIVHALDDIDLQGDSRQHVRDLVLLRLAQILDVLGDHQVNHES